MIIDKGAIDEILVLQFFGIQINITGIVDRINSNEDQFQVCECATRRLLEVNRTDGINREVLDKMTESRISQPILVTVIDEYEWVIDGNHRLFKRVELARESTCYIPINGEQLDPFVSEFSWG